MRVTQRHVKGATAVGISFIVKAEGGGTQAFGDLQVLEGHLGVVYEPQVVRSEVAMRTRAKRNRSSRKRGDYTTVIVLLVLCTVL